MKFIWERVVQDNKTMIHIGLLGMFTCLVWVKYQPHTRNIYSGPVLLYPLGVCDEQGRVMNHDRIEYCHCQAYDDLEIL